MQDLPTVSLTPSQLGCLFLCAHRHLLRYELSYHAPHEAATDYGTLTHCLLRLLHQRWTRDVTHLTSEEQLHNWVWPLACEHARLRFVRGEARQILLRSACSDIVRYVEARRQELRYVVESEVPFRFRLVPTSLLLTGRADVLLRRPGEGYTLRDFKSRKEEKDIGVVTHRTLAVSAYALEKQRGLPVESLEIYNLSTGYIDIHPFDDQARAKVLSTLQAAADVLRGKTRARRADDDAVCQDCDERPMCRPPAHS